MAYATSLPPVSVRVTERKRLTGENGKQRAVKSREDLGFSADAVTANGRELAREIVDEKSDDISTFLRCLYDHNQINGKYSQLSI